MSTATVPAPTTKTAVGAGAEMRTIHSAFRRELRLAPDLIRSVEHGDRLRANLVATHLDLLDRFLHHHHTVEDDLLWPKLLERVPAEIAPMVELMEAQHHTVAALLAQTVDLRDAWRQDADGSRAAELAGVYARLHDALVEHLDAEEQHVMPLVESCITHKEWAAIGKAAQRGTSLKDGPRTLGMLAYDGDPQVLRDMLCGVPTPVRGLVLKMGRRAYAKHAARVHGTPTP
ncbi:MAG TPA: hemerythrin domain-containing protein [Jatrophihabitans sp.]|nr:hemerythrin domain-containing protein [Jatrophihabitans sp.]